LLLLLLPLPLFLLLLAWATWQPCCFRTGRAQQCPQLKGCGPGPCLLQRTVMLHQGLLYVQHLPSLLGMPAFWGVPLRRRRRRLLC
jgi:hypothetical protein